MKLDNSVNDCCGCMACVNICPRNAISMVENPCGYKYPFVDENKCVNCGKCIKVCNYKKENSLNEPIKSFAAIAKNEKILLNSASGGVFSALASKVLEIGGIVYGAAFIRENGTLIAKHIRCTCAEEIEKLAGSKYVQSEIGYIYQDVKKDLDNQLFVLFSGTPCQVDGLKGYIGKDIDNLLCVDLICHGVPNQKIFSAYLQHLGKEKSGEITELRFRDKTSGWNLAGHYKYLDGKQINHFVTLDSKRSSYYQLFLGADIYRENCYNCKYAKISRCSDITVGDYWGIEEAHPSYLTQNGGSINTRDGVSCVLMNTEKALQFIKRHNPEILLYDSTVEKVKKVNKQLNQPSEKGRHRTAVLFIFKTFGYCGVEMYWKSFARLVRFKNNVKSLIRRE